MHGMLSLAVLVAACGGLAGWAGYVAFRLHRTFPAKRPSTVLAEPGGQPAGAEDQPADADDRSAGPEDQPAGETEDQPAEATGQSPGALDQDQSTSEEQPAYPFA